jgi:hypothetical protein
MKLLKSTLVLNAISCIVFGLLFLLAGKEVSAFIGNSIVWLVPVAGGVLLFNGMHLLFASKRSKPVCPEILYFVAGDTLWVLGSIALIGFGVVITSQPGVLAASAIALMVGTFGAMQVAGYRQTCMGKGA